MSSSSRSPWRFSYILTAELPRKINSLLSWDHRLRGRWEGYRGSLADGSDPGIDRDLARRLARHGCSPEEIVSTLFQRPGRVRRIFLQDCMDVAEASYFEEQDRRCSNKPRGRAR